LLVGAVLGRVPDVAATAHARLVRALRPLRSSGLLLRSLLLASRLVALLFLLPRALTLLLPRVVVLRALLLLRCVVLRALLLLRFVPLRALLLLRVVLPCPLLGALLFALRISVALLVPPPPIVVGSVVVMMMIVVVVIIVVLVDRDVDATRRRVATVVDVAAGVIGRSIAAVPAAASVVPARRPSRHEAPGKGDRQRREQDRRDAGKRETSRGMWAHVGREYNAVPAAVRLPFICSSFGDGPYSASQPSRKVRNTQ